jgi:serine/threonine protein kinase
MSLIPPVMPLQDNVDSEPFASTCPSTQVLRQYLTGWIDDDESTALETHLQQCPECATTLRTLEHPADTLLQSLQNTVSVEDARNMQTADESGPVARAIDRARCLMDPSAAATAESGRLAWPHAEREIGMYDLLKPLGRGGMGTVYLAVHRQLKKEVAIKLLPALSAEDRDVRARFEREIRVVGRLNHPSIVTATDAGEIDGTQFLVMEYIPGLDLSRIARLLGQLPVADACELMRQTALGLSCAHAEGVVHRDVKPSNLMLDDSGRIRILDFGLAQYSPWDEASVDLTTVGQLMGTLDYMAPEQAEFSGNVDYRADLYALGSTLFRLLCGRPPLAAAPNQSPLEKLRLLDSQQPPKLSTLCPQAPAELVNLVAILLSRNPQHRPASAAHVAEQLLPFVAGADLPGLLLQARQKITDTPDDSTSEQRSRFHAPNLAGEPTRRRIWGKVLAMAILPMLIVAGLLLKLELSKGQLVIESNADNVEVRLIREGTPVEGITVQHGTTATRLKADHYEIVIHSPSDGVTIDQEKFTLQSGETVVARISRVDSADASKSAVPGGEIPRDSKDASGVPEPLYEGKPLAVWLEMLWREKSPREIKSALDACSALASTESGAQITRTLLEVLPDLKGNMNLTPERDRDTVTLDRAAGALLWKANPGAEFYRQWIAAFEAADAAWRQRLWRYLNDSRPESVTTLEPFLAWAQQRLNQVPANAETPTKEETLKAAVYLRNLTSRHSTAIDDSFKPTVVDLLIGSPQLRSSWWLSNPIVYQDESGSTPLWLPKFQAEVTRHAITVFSSESPTDALVVQACMILGHGVELDPQQRAIIASSLARRLAAFCDAPDTMVTRVQTPEDFAQFSTPRISANSPLREIVITINVRHSYSNSIPVLDQYPVLHLLNLAEILDNGQSVQPELGRLMNTALATLEIINTRRQEWAKASQNSGRGGLGGRGTSRLTTVHLEWPELKAHEDQPTRGFGEMSETRGSRAPSRLWRDHEPTKRNWLDCVILQHPVMNRLVEEALVAFDAAVPANPAETKAPAQSPESGLDPAIKER